ncbi:hypothetical protein NEAUS03_1429 [Nematocida ausubeli]|nr:hypothetical protein NEAUS03_1429 [Nematocida ausubeli]
MNKRRYRDEESGQRAEERKPVGESEIYEMMLKKVRLLKEHELKLVTTKVPYEEYFRQYYEVWLQDKIMNGLFKSIWYMEKDLWMLQSHADAFMEFRDFIAHRRMSIRLETENKACLLQTELFDKFRAESEVSAPVVVIKGIGEKAVIRELLEKIQKEVEVTEWAMSQAGGTPESFQKTLYLRTEMDISEFKKAVKELIPEESILTVQYLPTAGMSRGIKEVGCQFMDKYSLIETEKQAKNILLRMSELFGVPDVYKIVCSLESKVQKEEIIDLYILALRKIFNFCYYCGVKYDNPYEMVFKCGLYHLRNNNVLDESSPVEYRKFISHFEIDRMGYLKSIPQELSVSLFYVEKQDNNEIECKYCNKKFGSIEFFEKHLERKKHKAHEMSIKLHSDFIKCIHSLNYQLIHEIERRYLKIPFQLYNYMCVNMDAKEQETDYSNLEKKYPILETNMPISIEEFSANEL